MKKTKIALVHDYIRESGGAERVLKVLSDMYPTAPIYTAFVDRKSKAFQLFNNKIIVESKLGSVLKIWKLYSPLRFLTPFVWGSFDLSKYDLVITSTSWYITRGFKIGNNTKVLAYCHTPPRNLYGLQTSIKWHGITWNKFLPAKIYASVVNHFLRLFDYKTAQKPDRKAKNIIGVDKFIANSKNVAGRIYKYYRRDSKVIYPPVNVSTIINSTKSTEKRDYFFIVSRIVDGKGLEEAAIAAKKAKVKLIIAGKGIGFSDIDKRLSELSGDYVKLVGEVSDEKLWHLYAGAIGFIAMAKNEDFGMTVVEAMAAGTPVIAFNGGGFRESVIDGKTGILINKTDEDTIKKAMVKLKRKKWNRKVLQNQAGKFSKERFKSEFKDFVRKLYLS